jgi:hypothetical protein
MACRHDPVPREAINREKFIDVLVDVHLAESIYHERYRMKTDSIESAALYLSVLEKHNVTDSQMLITTLYYSRYPREYDRIMGDVLTKISLLIEEENTEQEESIIKEKNITME